MTEWETPGRLFLVKNTGDTSGVPAVLHAIADQLPAAHPSKADHDAALQRARGELSHLEEGRHFLMLFIWDAAHQCFVPHVSAAFNEADSASVRREVSRLMDVALAGKANGIRMRSFGKPVRALSHAIFEQCNQEVRTLKTAIQEAVNNSTRH